MAKTSRGLGPLHPQAAPAAADRLARTSLGREQQP
jgi:hypothetical protein